MNSRPDLLLTTLHAGDRSRYQFTALNEPARAIGMPGIDQRFRHYPQLSSRLGCSVTAHHGTLTVMADLVLRTFQPLTRVAQLQNDGTLVADWEHVVAGTEHAYARMVKVMSEHGINTGDRPPIWAWHGTLRLIDADMLFDAVHELSRGFATLTFRAPEHLVLLSDYGHWCDALMAPPGYPVHRWRPARQAAGSLHPEQACLPYLHLDWVTDIKPLPTSGWDTLNLNTPL